MKHLRSLLQQGGTVCAGIVSRVRRFGRVSLLILMTLNATGGACAGDANGYVQRSRDASQTCAATSTHLDQVRANSRRRILWRKALVGATALFGGGVFCALVSLREEGRRPLLVSMAAGAAILTSLQAYALGKSSVREVSPTSVLKMVEATTQSLSNAAACTEGSLTPLFVRMYQSHQATARVRDSLLVKRDGIWRARYPLSRDLLVLSRDMARAYVRIMALRTDLERLDRAYKDKSKALASAEQGLRESKSAMMQKIERIMQLEVEVGNLKSQIKVLVEEIEKGSRSQYEVARLKSKIKHLQEVLDKDMAQVVPVALPVAEPVVTPQASAPYSPDEDPVLLKSRVAELERQLREAREDSRQLTRDSFMQSDTEAKESGA